MNWLAFAIYGFIAIWGALFLCIVWLKRDNQRRIAELRKQADAHRDAELAAAFSAARRKDRAP